MAEETAKHIYQIEVVDKQGRSSRMGLGDERRVDWRKWLDDMAAISLHSKNRQW